LERCRNHPERAAAARCPECVLFFCRECVTEHDGKLLCAACTRKSVSARLGKARSSALGASAVLLCAFVTAWLLFDIAEGLMWRWLK
jgi:hypothetical protein